MWKALTTQKLLPLLFLALFALCSCDGPIECIDADNWGQKLTTVITSKGTPSNTVPVIKDPNTGEVIRDAINWTKSYELDGKPLVLIVKNNIALAGQHCNATASFTSFNSWLPILGNELANKLDEVQVCSFNRTSTGYAWCPIDSDMEKDNVPVSNLPCKMNYGLGLYATIETAMPQAQNLACTTGKNCLLHIGDAKANIARTPFYDQLCPAASATFTPPPCQGPDCAKRALYFKILDRYYSDNLGGYTVEFIQGVRKPSGGIISKFVGLVQLILCNVTESLYRNIIAEPDFKDYIRVLLILYIIFLGFSSVMGFSQLSHKDLLIRVFKIGLIVQLTSTNSWEFFNGYFFRLFSHGVGVITGLIFGQEGSDLAPIPISVPWIRSSPGCSAQTLAGFGVFDNLINQLFSYETTRKILSLLVWHGIGFIYIPILYIGLGFILFLVLKSIIMYLVSFLIISILIALAPIFIPFFLFQLTRNFFDGWLSALVSYFVQPIIILTFSFFLLQLAMSQLHSMVGYRVCWKPWWQPIPKLNLILHAWQYDFDKDQEGCMATPNAILSYSSDEVSILPTTGSAIRKLKDGEKLKFIGDLNMEAYPGKHNCGGREGRTSDLCAPYNCTQIRYLGYPYLDRHFPQDLDRINDLQEMSGNKHAPNLVPLRSIIIFILIIWFMHNFSKSVPGIASMIAGGGISADAVAGGVLQTSNVTKAAAFAMKVATKPVRYITGKIDMATGRNLERFKDRLEWNLRVLKQLPTGVKQELQDYMGGKIEGVQNQLKNAYEEGQKSADGKKVEQPKGRMANLAFKLGELRGSKTNEGFDYYTAVTAPHKLIGEGLEKIGQTTRKVASSIKGSIGDKLNTLSKSEADQYTKDTKAQLTELEPEMTKLKEAQALASKKKNSDNDGQA